MGPHRPVPKPRRLPCGTARGSLRAAADFAVCGLRHHVADDNRRHTRLCSSPMRPRNQDKTRHNVQNPKSPIWAVLVPSQANKAPAPQPKIAARPLSNTPNATNLSDLWLNHARGAGVRRGLFRGARAHPSALQRARVPAQAPAPPRELRESPRTLKHPPDPNRAARLLPRAATPDANRGNSDA